MITVKSRVKFNHFGSIKRGMEARARAVVAEFGEDMLQEMRDLMEGPKSGRYYGAHQASAPGEAPAILTGQLIGSLTAEPRGLSVVVGASDEKALWLEYGTRFMSARPFFTPMVEKAREEWPERAKEIIDF